MMDLRSKLIGVLLTMLLMVGIGFYGYHKGTQACVTKELTKVVKGVQQDDAVEKAVGREPSAGLDAVLEYWLRD